jgi:aminoglycoside 3-N-acetyltransferase
MVGVKTGRRTRPWLLDDLVEDLSQLPIPVGRDILVHCAMSRIGWIDGGAGTLAAALREVIGPNGTLVTSTQTPMYSETSDAYRAATDELDAAGLAAFRQAGEGFDVDDSPSQGMGALAEYVRGHPDARRSGHPLVSLAALGPRAAEITVVHDPESHYGERSPLATLYAVDASILLVGVGYSSCTAFHLAEYRLSVPPPNRLYRCAVRRGGKRTMIEFSGAELTAHDFADIGAALDGAGLSRIGRVGSATATVLAMRPAVDFAVRWMDEHPSRRGLVRRD